MKALTVAGLVLAAGLGAGLGGYVGSSEAQPPPPVTADRSWLDGCTTDLDCAEMSQAMEQVYGDTVAEGEDSSPWEQAWLNVDCELTGPDESPLETPCLVAGEPEPFTDADDIVHEACVVVLTTAEDSVLVCDDGTEWPS